MADFAAAYQRVIAGSEGGYVDDPADSGGQTYAGITRRDWPHWQGWDAIDAAQPLRRGTVLHQLEPLVREFYRDHYWLPVRGDTTRAQVIAEEMLDVAVNCGIGVAVTFLQRCLNCLNMGGTLYPDIPVDGGMGPQTMAALHRVEERWGDVQTLIKLFNALQGARYVDLCERRERNERFIRGWAARV